MSELQAETLISGKYVLKRRISSGAGGVVWCASEKNGTEVALKILRWNETKSKKVLSDRFKREFELLTKLSHPNIAKIYDFGYDPDLDIYFFTSEFLSGGDLSRLIGLPVPEIERMLLSSLHALKYLQNFGILHLDVKPKNLLLRAGGEGSGDVVLIDFGLAAFTAPDKPGGTPNYIAPEVVLKRFSDRSSDDFNLICSDEVRKKIFSKPDFRSDIYSLGVSFYNILTGVKPFAVLNEGKGLDIFETMKKHLSIERPKLPSFYNSEVPSYLDDIIMKMISLYPDDRYETAALAAHALCFRSPNRLEVTNKDEVAAYLPDEGMLIGRQKEIKKLTNLAIAAAGGVEGYKRIVCIAGKCGTGKSRLLGALKPIAQQNEMVVVRDLKLQDIDLRKPTAFLIDDPLLPKSSFEEYSISDVMILKRLIQYVKDMPRSRNLIVLTLNTDFQKIKECLSILPIGEDNCELIELDNFKEDELADYLKRLLGEEVHETIVADLHRVSYGNPRFVSDIFKQMMERGQFYTYFSGRPSSNTIESLGFSFSHAASPKSLSNYVLEMFELLPQSTREIVKMIACIRRPVSLGELDRISQTNISALDIALLLSSGLLNYDENEGKRLSFVNPISSKIIESSMTAGERAGCHDKIAAGLELISSDFEIELHLALGGDAKKKSAAAFKVATEALKRMHPAVAAELIGDVLQAADKKDWKLCSSITVWLGRALTGQGRLEEARHLYVGLGDISDEPVAASRLAYKSSEQLGILEMRRRQLAKAREYFEEAKQNIEKLRKYDPKKADIYDLRITNSLAGCHMREGNIADAEKMFMETALRAKKLPAEVRWEITNNELGETLFLGNKLREATQVLNEELDDARKAWRTEGMVTRLRLLGDAHRRLGEKYFDKAISYYEEAYDNAKKYYLFENQLRIANSIGNLLLQKCDWKGAVERYKSALDLAVQLEGKSTAVDIMANLGFAYNKLARYDDAIENLELALDFSRGPEAESLAQVKSVVPHIHISLGHAYYEKHLFDKSLHHLNEAKLIDGENKLDVKSRYNLYATLTEVALAKERPDTARGYLPLLERLVMDFPEARDHLKSLQTQIKHG